MSITALPVESSALSTGNEQTWKAWLIERIDPQWRVAEWDSRRQVFTGDVDNEMTAVYLCRVDRCMTVVEIFDRRCRRCERHRKLNGTSPSFFDRTFDPDSVPRRDEKAFSKVDFELSEVNGTVAAEIIYGVQQRDRDQIILVPMRIRSIVSHLPPDCRSLLDVAGNRQFEKALGAAAGGVFRSLVTHLQRAHVVYSGTDPTMADVWKPAVVGLQAAPDRRYSAAGGVVDFREIRQRWLREITKQFGREVRPPVTTLRHTVHAAEIASRQLSLRTNGDHPELLDHGDMSAVVEGFRTSADREGKPHSFTHRRSLLGWWRRLLEFSRRTGAMDDIPGSFALDLRSHTIAQVETSEDDFGRTIPEHVIAQLDQHLELLGRHSTYSAPGWNPDDYAMMYQTVYQIIRDTGRRPSEIVGLKRSCLDWVDGKPTLVYDNRKRRRMGRRLPISTATATVIDQWLDHLQSLSVPDTLCDWLFPTPGTRNNIRRGHLSGAQFGSRAFAIWIDAIPELVDERLDDDGNPALYDRSMITPYGLRHSYAQRHADNGTPVDVLRELMDHRSVDTTMGYFSVTLKRKRQATEEISKFAIDRHGRPAGFTSVTEYERQSVAVPFGNCTETLEHQSRRPTLPDPIPVRRMLLLPTGPVLPARNRAASRRAAHRQRNCNRHRLRVVGDHQLRRPNSRVHGRHLVDGRNACRPARRPTRGHRQRLPRTEESEDRSCLHTARVRNHPHERGRTTMTADDRDIRTQRLIASRRRDSADKQRRTLTVIADLSSAGERINISEIARRAGVSPWFIYNTAAIRTAVERATEEHSHTATRSSAGRTSATADSLHAELLMAREEVRALRTDRTKLETKVQLLLGNQLEHLPHDTLLARIHELEQIAAELRSDLDSERRRADTMTTRTEELQDELTAARASLKRMVQSVSPARRIEAIGT